MSVTVTVPDRQANETVRRKADEVAALPDGRFLAKDIGPLRMSLYQFAEKNIVETVGEAKPFGDSGPTVHVHAVRSRPKQLAEEMVSGRDAICPCGHGGLRNQGDRYVCGFRFCPNTYARDDLEVHE